MPIFRPGLLQACQESLDAWWTKEHERRCIWIVEQLGHAERVVGVEVRDEHRALPLNAQAKPLPGFLDPAEDARPGIEDVEGAPNDNANAGAGAFRAKDGCAVAQNNDCGPRWRAQLLRLDSGAQGKPENENSRTGARRRPPSVLANGLPFCCGVYRSRRRSVGSKIAQGG